ncbi:sensor histidine kinase [Rhodospirillum sp. A1_3_36]|uniref:sensor histidine kinase n=1 Tax=Rhodospirillum sp. A1_3_36 TaxID=3391666 RepID=UPI0039A5FDA0
MQRDALPDGLTSDGLKKPVAVMVLLGVVIFVTISTALIACDAFDRFYAFSRGHEDWDLDELVLVGFTGLLIMSLWGVCFAMLAIRRLRGQMAATEAARKEAEQHAARARLAEAARTRFLSNMSHELRTPLNAIGGFSDLLMEDLLEREENGTLFTYAKHINEAGESLTALVDDVLTLTDLETRDPTVVVDVVDPLQCLETVADELKPLLAPRASTIVLMSPVLPVPPVQTNREYLSRILRNLLGELVLECPGSDILCQSDTSRKGEFGLTLMVRNLVWSEERIRELENMHDYGEGEARRPRQGPGTGLAISLARGFLAVLGGRLELIRDSGGARGFRVVLTAP